MRLLLVINQLLNKLSRMMKLRIRDQVFLDLALLKWELKILLNPRQINLNLPLVEEDHSELLKWEMLKRIKKNHWNKSLLLVVFQWTKNLKRLRLLHSVVFQWIKKQLNKSPLHSATFKWKEQNQNLLKMVLWLSQLFNSKIVNYR